MARAGAPRIARCEQNVWTGVAVLIGRRPPRDTVAAMSLVEVSQRLSARVSALSFRGPVTHVYNPLDYARRPHEIYLKKYGAGGAGRILLVGMNPGPFGMAQTGVPFGDVASVRDFLGITARVGTPATMHPKRPIDGFACRRAEISGTRLWGWVRERFGTADAFFRDAFIANYCPLVFMEASGRNRTPDKLAAAERDPLFAACDEALRAIVAILEPAAILAVGGFATARARAALPGRTDRIHTMLHPSPASPLANRSWVAHADAALARCQSFKQESTPVQSRASGPDPEADGTLR
jgi:single-strand selective monofunctional uracil DNA glycosylase